MTRLRTVAPAGRPPEPRASLTGSSFETLLAFLDADRERAGGSYEAIRRRLVKFFECHGSAEPEAQADETIDRVGRRLAGGETIQAGEPFAYFYGVARNVLRESWRRGQQQRAFAEAKKLEGGRATAPPTEVDTLQARRLDCLDRCLETLSPADRNLILWYYQRGERVMVEARKELAGRLGIPLNALWIRAHRIRARLEACVERRLALSAPGEMEMPSPARVDAGEATRTTGGEA